MLDCSLIIMSCDTYEDTWQPFFKLKEKYWKDCPYETYVVSETKDCMYANTIKQEGAWTKRLREALKEIKTDYVLLMLDDFFIRDYVDQKRIDKIKFNDNTAVYNFELAYESKIKGNAKNGFKLRENNSSYMLSCQPSIWNRKILIELLDKDMTPHEWEYQILNSKYEFYINVGDLIIDIGYYNHKKWSIVNGKWHKEIVPFFERENIDIDYTRRGFYDIPTLSIIIPFYKTRKQTEKLLDILVPQLNDAELILTDDGCNEDWSMYPIKVIHQANAGVSKARNQGLDIARGSYIAFVDSDDSVPSYYVKKILDKTKEDWDYCLMSWEYIDEQHKGQQTIITEEPPEWNRSVWNCIYKRELIGEHRFDENLKTAEDKDFNQRVRKGKRANITDIMYYYNWGRPDSLSVQAMHENNKIKGDLVVYQYNINKIGGIEKFLYEFFKEFHDKYDITFLYTNGDLNQLLRYRKLVKCIKYTGQQVVCNKYINASTQHEIVGQVEAKENFYAKVFHADFTAMNWKFYQHPKTNYHIAVSEIAKESVIKQAPDIPCEVIYNLIKIEKPKRVLNLISMTRLTEEKGAGVMNAFAKRLKELEIPYNWVVFTDAKLKSNDGMIYRTPELNTQDYINNFKELGGYYFSGSKTESWGYSLAEALEMGLPLITTRIPVLDELGFEEGVNGFILEQDLSNLDDVIQKAYSNNLKFKHKKKDKPKQWIKLLGEFKESNYKPSNKITIRAKTNYNDIQVGRLINKGEIYEVTEQRALLLNKLEYAEME